MIIFNDTVKTKVPYLCNNVANPDMVEQCRAAAAQLFVSSGHKLNGLEELFFIDTLIATFAEANDLHNSTMVLIYLINESVMHQAAVRYQTFFKFISTSLGQKSVHALDAIALYIRIVLCHGTIYTSEIIACSILLDLQRRHGFCAQSGVDDILILVCNVSPLFTETLLTLICNTFTFQRNASSSTEAALFPSKDLVTVIVRHWLKCDTHDISSVQSILIDSHALIASMNKKLSILPHLLKVFAPQKPGITLRSDSHQLCCETSSALFGLIRWCVTQPLVEEWCDPVLTELIDQLFAALVDKLNQARNFLKSDTSSAKFQIKLKDWKDFLSFMCVKLNGVSETPESPVATCEESIRSSDEIRYVINTNGQVQQRKCKSAFRLATFLILCRQVDLITELAVSSLLPHLESLQSYEDVATLYEFWNT